MNNYVYLRDEHIVHLVLCHALPFVSANGVKQTNLIGVTVEPKVYMLC